MTDEPQQVDARGMACPRPVIELAAAVDVVAIGETVELWADDPAARVDVAVWARMRGHRLMEVTEMDGATCFRVRKSG